MVKIFIESLNENIFFYVFQLRNTLNYSFTIIDSLQMQSPHLSHCNIRRELVQCIIYMPIMQKIGSADVLYFHHN